MSEKKTKTKHETIKAPSKATNWWMIASLGLAVLLIISIATSGFGIRGPTVKSIISDANNLKASTQDSDLKAALETIAATLQPYDKSTSGSTYTGDKVTIVEYSDFQCPFCKRANDDAVAKVKKNFGDAVVFEFKHFPLSFHPNAQKAAEASECANDQGKFWEYHDKLFANQGSLDVASLKKYASELGLDSAKFTACLDSGMKAGIVAADMAEGQNKGVQGTPAFFIGDQMISGAQPYESFLPIICAKIPNHEACKNAPKPVAFKIYVIEDLRCTDCDSTRIVQVLQQLFVGATIEKVDYNTARGKELYNIAGVTYLPMYILEKTVKDDPSYSKVEAAMQAKGDYYVILPQAVGATFDPNGEICTNGVDDNADGITDCADAKCSQSLECREELKKNVQVFIMSDCPYGKKAVEALYEAKKNFGAEMTYDIHYIASDNGDGTFDSLHGSYEAEEDIRQLCAKKIAPDKYLEYVNCRSVNGVRGVDYTSCANSAGIDAAAIKTCSEGDEGASLLREDIKIADALGISASPTWLANNRYQFSGIDAETVKTNFCQYNQGTTGCENTLSADAGVPAGNCG